MSTKAAQRFRDSRGFSTSHGSRLSIDPDHHVTEAIGDMYGEYSDESGNRQSFIQSSDPSRNSNRLSTLGMQTRGPRGTNNGPTPPASPTLSLRSASPSVSDTATKSFPLNDIDYESNPVAVAQELSNLQALRRMSMDVTSSADPDLPSFNNFVPSTPPDDGDPGSVFWVPARLHPELAPQEFKHYLEAKKKEIRKPTHEKGSLSPDLNSGSGSLRRKKSMLSRQIDDSEAARAYKDGAERLERRKSTRDGPAMMLQLDDLIKDPSSLMRKLSVDGQKTEEDDNKEDLPILPAPKIGLKRSKMTHYGKPGSLRRSERAGKRLGAVAKATEAETEDASSHPAAYRLDRIATEPLPAHTQLEDRQSSLRTRRSPISSSPSTSFDELLPKATADFTDTVESKHKSAPPAKPRRSISPKGAARTRTSEPSPPVPRIVETPPPTVDFPERHSSIEFPQQPARKQRPPLNRTSDSTVASVPPLDSRLSEPAASLESKGERKEKRRPESSGSAGKDRKTSWGWFLGDSEKDKEKDDKKEREKEEKSRARKEKRPKSAERHDNTRLDVLQKSIEMGNSGKVVTADTSGVKTEEKEARKSRSEDKKEKESGFLSFFGGSRKKSGDHSTQKAKGSSSRGTSPDPPHEKPQAPFYYTRFPIHIERAIYRLSHLKLANPKRPLQQQVLLSNFMYSYLAKVQQTQPHLIQQATVSQPKDNRQPQQQIQQSDSQNNQYYSYEDSSQGSTEYVDDSQMYEYEDNDRPQSRASQHSAGAQQHAENGYYADQSDYHHRRGGEYSNGGGGGGGGGGTGAGGSGGGYYGSNRTANDRSGNDDMW